MGNRINPIKPNEAKGAIKDSYNNLEKTMGRVPNFFQNLANSPETLKAYFMLQESLKQSSLPEILRTQIALTVSQANECNYCLNAYSMFAQKEGLKPDQINQARQGATSDPKTNAILHFAQTVLEKRANVSEQDVSALKKFGVNDKEIIEIILTVISTLFTNYVNLITGTPIDFPAAPPLEKTALAR